MAKDKTNREYIEHQILWAVNAAYGSGAHYINLGTGLPISIYKAKKEEFAQKLRGLGTIEGVVNGKEISVNIVEVKVPCEMRWYGNSIGYFFYYDRAYR